MPEVVHEHYNPEGALVGRTVIRSESPWDDAARKHAEAALLAADLICPKCGNLRSICSNPDLTAYPTPSTCHVSAVREQAERMWQAVREGKSPESVMAAGLPQATDGTHIWASLEDLAPESNFPFPDDFPPQSEGAP